MAKTAPFVKYEKFECNQKTHGLVLSRRDDGSESVRLQFPVPDERNLARLLLYGQNLAGDDGVYLNYGEVKWLAQAIPELLNEMERAGAEDR